jgi:hypothetical protein
LETCQIIDITRDRPREDLPPAAAAAAAAAAASGGYRRAKLGKNILNLKKDIECFLCV